MRAKRTLRPPVQAQAVDRPREYWFAIDFRAGLSQQGESAWAAWAAHPGTAEAPSRAAARAHRSQRSRPMFDISCGDDGGPASCGIFGGSVGGGGAKQPQTLAGLLKKLDLSEYEPKFVAAGITDVR